MAYILKNNPSCYVERRFVSQRGMNEAWDQLESILIVCVKGNGNLSQCDIQKVTRIGQTEDIFCNESL